MNEIKVVYTPGVCNIGPAEIARRRNVGWLGLIVTIILLAILFYFNASHWLRIFTILPAFAAASGFLQAYFHFCSGFAKAGVYNLGEVGSVQQVADESAKTKDARKGFMIMMYALLIAIIFTVIVLFI